MLVSGVEVRDERKITYDVTNKGGTVVILCHLPKGFKMREYTRMYFTKDAKDYGMTEEQYILWQKEELLKDLFARMEIVDKTKFLKG